MGYGMHGDDLNLTTNPEGFGFVVSDLFPNASYYSSFPSETFEERQPEGVAVDAETNMLHCIGVTGTIFNSIITGHWIFGNSLNGEKCLFL